MTEEGEKAYWAFISYSRQSDEGFARKIHSGLENLRIPKVALNARVHQNLSTKRLSPVCLDRHEFGAASQLPEELSKRVRSSEFLILICSPDAADSPWINHEVETFLQCEQRDQYLLVISGGDPEKPDSCFPPALVKHLENQAAPLYLDARSRDSSVRDVVHGLAAGMLGISLDDFERRHRRARRRRALLALLSLVTILGAGLGLYWDLKIRKHITFYSTFVSRNGVPEGYRALTGKEVSQRRRSYRFTTEGRLGPVKEVATIDSQGELCPIQGVGAFSIKEDYRASTWFSRECRWTFDYDRSSRLSEERAFSKSGAMMFKINYDYDPDQPDLLIARIESERGETLSLPSKATKQFIKLNEQGFQTALYFVDQADKPVKFRGHYGQSFHPDPTSGLNRRTEYLDQDLLVIPPSSKPAAIEYDRAMDGTVKVTRFHPANRSGIHEIRYLLDEVGDSMGERYFNRDGKPLLVNGIHGFDLTKDSLSRISRIVYVDTRGQPTDRRELGGACGLRYDFQGSRNEGTVSFLGSNLEPAETTSMIAGYRFLFQPTSGKNGAKEAINFINIDGKPCRISPWGFSRRKTTYSPFGKIVSDAFFDEDGNALNCAGPETYRRTGFPPSSYHRVEIQYKHTTWSPVEREFFVHGKTKPQQVETWANGFWVKAPFENQ